MNIEVTRMMGVEYKIEMGHGTSATREQVLVPFSLTARGWNLTPQSKRRFGSRPSLLCT
jgi:hypothetical protein